MMDEWVPRGVESGVSLAPEILRTGLERSDIMSEWVSGRVGTWFSHRLRRSTGRKDSLVFFLDHLTFDIRSQPQAWATPTGSVV